MAEPVLTMPSLGADMESGTLVEWLVAPGDRVTRGQVVAVVETHKGAIDVEIWQDGTIASLEVPVGETVPVGTVLARLTEAGPAAQTSQRPAAPPPTAPAPPPERPEPAPERPAGWVRSAPAARRRAAELGISLADVVGTGPHGAVTRADVEAAARSAAERPSPPPEPAAPAQRPDARAAMRQAIAAAMSRSNREIPHYYLSHHVDVSGVLAAVAKRNRDRPIEERLLPAALYVRAVAVALSEHRELNGSWIDGALRPADGVHPGIAIALRGGGLVVPALHDADRKSADEVMAGLKDLTARARSGRLRSSELTDATTTITALGDRGVEAVFGVIYPPQVALVGIGTAVERPWAIDGMLAVRPVVQLTLAADHRASDGHLGSLFLSRIERLLAAPEAL